MHEYLALIDTWTYMLYSAHGAKKDTGSSRTGVYISLCSVIWVPGMELESYRRASKCSSPLSVLPEYKEDRKV